MNELTDLEPNEISDLEQRAQGRCITFRNHQLPLGCEPRRARVGIEVLKFALPVRLHVDRSTRYRGCDTEVEQWTTTGTKEFTTIGEALTWLTQKMTEDEPAVVEDAAFVEHKRLIELVAGEVIGQTAPIRTTCRAAARHLARTTPRRPLTLLYAGPTGVGKTHSAYALATALRAETQEPWPFIRLDMNEMSEAHSVAKILGAPPGYVGYRDESQLVATLQQEPRAVILFDEIEKAHPKVFQAIMNLLDAGRLGAHVEGPKIDARKAIIIFTSNIAADELLQRTEALRNQDNQQALDEIGRAHLGRHGVPPELAGRITHVCVFRPLGRNAYREVLYTTVHRVAESYGLHLIDIDQEALVRLETGVSSSGAGVRGMEYAVDALIGDLIVEARRDKRHKATLVVVDETLALT